MASTITPRNMEFARTFVAMVISVLVTEGCLEVYLQPAIPPEAMTTRLIAKPLREAWETSIAELKKHSFSIDYTDASAQLIGVSYRGNPEPYIDCGQIKHAQMKPGGRKIVHITAAKSRQDYEVVYGRSSYFIQREVALAGNTKLIFSQNGANSTQVKATTRYQVTRHLIAWERKSDEPTITTDVIIFDDDESAYFPKVPDRVKVECISTRQLDRDILAALAP